MKGIFEKTWKIMKIAAVFVWRNRRKRMSLRDRRGTGEEGWREDRGRTFPDYNPYTIRRCRDCGMNSGKGKLAFVAENELCRGCKIIRECYQKREKANREDLTRYTPEKKNPDLIVGSDFVDVKSPFSTSNIVRNANEAVRQGSIACITDHLTVIPESKIKHFAGKIFGDKNYTKDTVYFYVKKKLYKITTADL